MADDVMPIKLITRNTRDWKARVRVLEKWHPRISQKSLVKYQRIVLADSEGTRVQAMLYADQVEKLKDTLQLFKTYYISNAVVKFLEPSYRTGSYTFQWTINARTLIQLAEDNFQDDTLPAYNFVPFNEFCNHMDAQSEIDIIAAMTEIRPPKHVNSHNDNPNAQEIIIINQEMKPTLLTLCDQFLANEGLKLSALAGSFPVFIGIRLKVSTFNGISLSTKPMSTLILNPDSLAAHALQSWCIENEDNIKVAILELELGSRRKKTPTPNKKKISLIKDLPTSVEKLEQIMYWIKAKMTITSLDQNFWYMACNKCYRPINAKFQTIFDYYQCGTKEVIAQPRVRFQVELKDDSGTMMATMFEDNAEEYFNLNGIKLMEHSTKDGKIAKEAFSNLEIQENHNIQLKPRQYQAHGTSKLQYTVGTINDDNDVQAAESLPPPSDTSEEQVSQPKAKKELFPAETSIRPSLDS